MIYEGHIYFCGSLKLCAEVTVDVDLVRRHLTQERCNLYN